MKIAIPLAEGRLARHFGHCQEFALCEVDEEDSSVIEMQTLSAPAHEPGLLPRWLREHGADLVIAGGMGRRAQDLFARSGVEVVVGAPAEQPRAIVESYLSDRLQTGENICDH
ncbi:MAG: NifB/NifX family molybdenum-iron cluster-binding protein [Candidatus Brocadiia bacterium]